MRKQVLATITVCVTLIALVFMLSGCGSTKPSGKYIDPNDSAVYLTFDGDKVTLHESSNQTRNGTFTVSGKSANGYLLRITYEGVSSEVWYWLNENKSEMRENVEGKNEQGQTVNNTGDVAFVKE